MSGRHVMVAPPSCITSSGMKCLRPTAGRLLTNPRNMTDASRLKATIWVKNVADRAKKDDLYDFFVPFGEIVEVTLPKPELPSSTESHRHFAYVEFEHAQDAREAIDNFDGADFFGQSITVAAAKPQKDPNAGLGSKTAVWEQVGLIETPNVPFTL